MYRKRENRGKSKFAVDDKKNKKMSWEILADRNREIFREKVTFWKFSTESENFSKIGGNLKQGEMHHGLRGDGRPWRYVRNWDAKQTWTQTRAVFLSHSPIRNFPTIPTPHSIYDKSCHPFHVRLYNLLHSFSCVVTCQYFVPNLYTRCWHFNIWPTVRETTRPTTTTYSAGRYSQGTWLDLNVAQSED